MSERNGDRARFQTSRKRKLRRRQRVQLFVKALRARTPKSIDIRLESHAQTAVAEPARLEAREAPQRDVVPQRRKTADSRVAQRKTRLVNNTGSKP